MYIEVLENVTEVRESPLLQSHVRSDAAVTAPRRVRDIDSGNLDKWRSHTRR